MDGLPQVFSSSVTVGQQHTLRAAISCVGTGVHSGARVAVTLRPAESDSGIVFHRTDRGATIPARFDHVVDTRLATTLAHRKDPACRIGTVEHLMAALAGAGIDNLHVEVDGPELPIFDGSASSWLFLIDCAGAVAQDAPRRILRVVEPIRIVDGAAWAELAPPGAHDGLDLGVTIDFSAAAIGRQSLALRLTAASFRHELARARTFALAEDVDALRAAGFAQGGGLHNAVVVDGAKVLNPGGLRMPDEFARHKLLDAVGDLALAGRPLCARYRSHRGGHALNNRLLCELFANPSAWREEAGFSLADAAA
jgi:UDP-3-O-[3-hydroxymyristoyl] N-acetylglucosamine deacetylase